MRAVRQPFPVYQQSNTSKIIKPLSSKPVGFSKPSIARSSFTAKNWRQKNFSTPAPASRREVELLGEWLNSVLAENLEQNDNPLDVCVQAQHWFSVAFNELVRQVSIDCAERGRLFAVLWKRNQQFLTKLFQVQKEECKYILTCHKDRMQFLKTDLEYVKSQLNTVQSAYEEDKASWNSTQENDGFKLVDIQKKIDEQVQLCNKLNEEIKALKAKLKITDTNPEEEIKDEPTFSFSSCELESRSQNFRWKMRENVVSPLDIANVLNDVEHFVDFSPNSSFDPLKKFPPLFLSLPSDTKPNKRSLQWVFSIISYIYSNYMTYFSYKTYDKSLLREPFCNIVYDILLNVYGSRFYTERTLYDLLETIKEYIESGISRITLFARFFGLIDPLPIQTLHFYLYTLTMMNKANPGPLFPDISSGKETTSLIPIPSACNAAEIVLKRFSNGKILEFYIERLIKISGADLIRFSGKNLVQLDGIIDFILTAYNEECMKINESLKDKCNEILQKNKIITYSQFENLLKKLKFDLKPNIISELFGEAINISKDKQIDVNVFMEVISNNGLNFPIIFSEKDFLIEQNTDDIIKFMQLELNEFIPKYNVLVEELQKTNDEILIKQLKTAKDKFEQTLQSKTLKKTMNAAQQEFYEKIYTTELYMHNILK